MFEAMGVRDLGILIDWCSLFQAPRDEEQQRVFGAALKAINQVLARHANLWLEPALTERACLSGTHTRARRCGS